MENKELNELLQQLHDEINRTRTVDEKSSKVLRDLGKDIRTLLERSEGTPDQVHPSMVQRLEAAFRHFEVTHPDLTTLISKLLESLSTAGL